MKPKYIGRPCPKGHTLRWVGSCKCVECNRLDKAALRADDDSRLVRTNCGDSGVPTRSFESGRTQLGTPSGGRRGAIRFDTRQN